ncbi:MAG: FmdB family zinc ribbon protein [Candidatus Methylumidiphilus sp.]
MPTYDYQCQACRQTFTALHKISEPAPPCPHCGSALVQKKLSAPAVQGGGKAPASPAGQGCGMGGCGHKH